GLLEGRWRLLQLLRPAHRHVVRTGFRRMGRAAFRERSETHAVAVARTLGRPEMAVLEALH
ncbi:hypothetical protein, partial [Pseudomonas tohonis]|uniref:hypothetical protein n=1 Tax=Pseudomonas tohonis TaxID=2725477 RepID=UPI001F486595